MVEEKPKLTFIADVRFCISYIGCYWITNVIRHLVHIWWRLLKKFTTTVLMSRGQVYIRMEPWFNEGPKDWHNMFVGCSMLQNCLGSKLRVFFSHALLCFFHGVWLPYVKRKIHWNQSLTCLGLSVSACTMNRLYSYQ